MLRDEQVRGDCAELPTRGDAVDQPDEPESRADERPDAADHDGQEADGVDPSELAARRDQVLLNRELATLRTDVPLPEGPRSAEFGASARARLRALFTELEFKSLLGRLDALPP